MEKESNRVAGTASSWRRRQADRQIVCAFLPDLAVSQQARIEGWPVQLPVALWQSQHNRQLLVCVNEAAAAAGLHQGMRLADARALLPETRFAAFDSDRLAGLLVRLAKWAWRYSPLAGVDMPHSLFWVETGGATHLQGGPEALLADMDQRLAAAGLSARLAMAPNYGAAFALACHAARPGQPLCLPAGRAGLIAALSGLPVAGLRLSPEQVAGLAQAGLRTIGQLLALPRAGLALRFGPQLLQRRDQLLGDLDERLAPLADEQPVMASCSWPEPIAGPEALAGMVKYLIAELAALMARRQLRCRLLEIGWQQVDGQRASQLFALSRPSREAAVLTRLAAELPDCMDAGFGIEYGWARAGRLSFGLPENLQLDRRADRQMQLDHLVDHLAARLGADKIRRLLPCADWQPDRAQQSLPVSSLNHNGPGPRASQQIPVWQIPIWQIPGPDSLVSPRPLRLLAPPEPIEATALLPDHPPRMLRWRGQSWTVCRASGPERIAPPWWQAGQTDRQAEWRSADYYRLETEKGARLWVSRAGLPERGEQSDWFLHGFFA